ncbi:PREDICTED: cingulin-like [Amphimedon queenslandica]|uniref:Uncharacterized protein n=1 Tax=Amphimedon queenslandica TaxID=400682 RepID=A0AAN0K4H6_AMPQE|nr:PREDICTED: cingulin-like [Amphimedon queenslandica]|eukprot:XP_019864433.1 PREDICTED: cingulin-like [Amphimedon queenslandica]
MAADRDCDLSSLVEDFEQWQKITFELFNENKELKSEVSSLKKQFSLHEEAERTLKDNNSELLSTVKKLQDSLMQRCEMISENSKLKERMERLQRETSELEAQHKDQMREAMDNLEAIKEAHKKDVVHIQAVTSKEMRKEIDLLQRNLQEKSEDISALQKQVGDAERDKHTEIVKLRLEYDAKLLKIQKQTAKSQTQTSSSTTLTNNSIFRQKLQAVKVESEKEVKALRKRVLELEKELMSKNKQRKLH